MLYYLHYLTDLYSPLRVFQYITVRAFAAAGTAFIITLILGPWIIGVLQRLKVGQQVRKEEAIHLYEFHGKKQGTPTMGGLLIIFSVVVSTWLWAVPSNIHVWFVVMTFLYMGGIGFWDDYLKITQKQSKGLRARSKLYLQGAWVCIVICFLWMWPGTRETVGHLMAPFLKEPMIENIGLIGSFLFVSMVILGSTNAVNLTDGLDGLAIGCTNSVAFAYLIMSYLAGHALFADYLHIPYLSGSGELAVFTGGLLGAGLGFLWFNCHPAKLFMGDTGSMAIGGAIAMIAILIKQELVLVIVGGVFVIEALSVVLQVASFKITGKRIFRCSPLHHHFELLEKERAGREGRDIEVVETMITIRFWILSIIFALIGVAILKIR